MLGGANSSRQCFWDSSKRSLGRCPVSVDASGHRRLGRSAAAGQTCRAVAKMSKAGSVVRMHGYSASGSATQQPQVILQRQMAASSKRA